MRKIKGIAAWLCTAAAVMLTGCGSAAADTGHEETDLAARYPEYFRYCFGDDASYTFLETEQWEQYHSDVWQLRYHDAQGKEHVYEQLTGRYTDLEEPEYSEDEYYRGILLTTVQHELWTVCEEDLQEQILKPLFGDRISVNPESGTVHAELEGGACELNPTWGLGTDLEFSERSPEQIDINGGFQVCTADMKSLAQDERFMLGVDLTVSDESQKDALEAKLREFEQVYVEKTGGPQSYSMVMLTADESTGELNVLYETDWLLGSRLIPEKGVTTVQSYMTTFDYTQALKEKYENQ